MRVGIVSDIHGNWTALQAVVRRLGQLHVDAILGGGDYLWTTADPYPLYRTLAALPVRLVVDLAGYRILVQHEWWPGLRDPAEQLARIHRPPYVSPQVDLAGVDIAIFGDSHLPLHHATPDRVGRAFLLLTSSVRAPPGPAVPGAS